MRYNKESLYKRISWLEGVVFASNSDYTPEMRDEELQLLREYEVEFNKPESTVRSLKILRLEFKLLELLHDRKVKMAVNKELTSTVSRETYKQLYFNLQDFYGFQLITTIDDLTDIINETQNTTRPTV